jgi:hypothetical protein
VILKLLSGPTLQSTGTFFHCRSPGRDGKVGVGIDILPLQGSIQQYKDTEDYNTLDYLKEVITKSFLAAFQAFFSSLLSLSINRSFAPCFPTLERLY